MSEDNKDVLARFYKEVFENGNVDAIDDLTTTDFVDHEMPPQLNLPQGREGLKQWIRMWIAGFGAMRVEVEDLLADGDKVVARATFYGTHTGEFMGIPATNKDVAVNVIDIVRFENGKGAEHWGRSDDLGLLTQIGVVPPMG